MSESSKTKTIHLVAACGTAMGTLAGILREQGYHVTGSDQNVYPPMSLELEKRGVELMNGYAADHLSHRPDLVVIGNAVRKDNVEARAAIDGGFAYLSFTDALAEYFLTGKESIVIAGTHGKTTTTSLLSEVLIDSGLDPSVFVGGIANNLAGSFRIGKGRYAVLEGDEYDTAFFDKTPKFWHYRVHHALCTHVEYDHADIYPTVEAVEAAFAKFIELIPPEGSLTACASAPRLVKLLKVARCPVETYSIHEGADWKVTNVVPDPEGTTFVALRHGQAMGEFRVPLVGQHNLENALGVVALAHRLGLSSKQIASGLAHFTGVKRRMEIRGERRGVTVVDDFAHHPTAVKATLEAAAQRFPGRRLIAIFEPRSQTSRRKVFQAEYEGAFARAAAAYIARPFGESGLKPEERFEPEELVLALRHQGLVAEACSDADAIVALVTPRAAAGDVILVMSNGGFGGIHDKLLKALS